MKKIVYLPLDERPCNLTFPRLLFAENPDFTLVSPNRKSLGNKKIPAEFDQIERFLVRECEHADILVLSVDMLLYGGIVPSRLHTLSEKELIRRLALLRKLKENNAQLKIYAFALIMRCPSYSSDDEEPDYYAYCGREIFLLGQLEHTFREGMVSSGEYACKKAEFTAKTAGCLDDYLARREVNLKMLYKTLDLTRDVIDYLVIPQDDSAPYGYTATDRACVENYLREHGLKAENYPGADEVGMVLTARAVNEAKGGTPKVAVVYATAQGREIIPLYEDRPIHLSIAAQIRAAGCCQMEEIEQAELVLFVNVPSRDMTDINGAPGQSYAERDLAAFTAQMAETARTGKLVLAADVAYCNGGDAEWVSAISREIGFFALGGYAGWNTSSNTLGTVIAEGVLCHYYGFTPAHKAFLAERAFEDVGYCGHVRRKVCDTELYKLGLDYFHTDGRDGEVARLVKEELTRYMRELLPELASRYEITNCTMPWSRMFEVALTVEKKKSADRG